MYYARVVFETNATAVERHEQIDSAREWIDEERLASPKLFRLGQIIEGTPRREVVASCDASGWEAASPA
jgi:hypothetical protein